MPWALGWRHCTRRLETSGMRSHHVPLTGEHSDCKFRTCRTACNAPSYEWTKMPRTGSCKTCNRSCNQSWRGFMNRVTASSLLHFAGVSSQGLPKQAFAANLGRRRRSNGHTLDVENNLIANALQQLQQSGHSIAGAPEKPTLGLAHWGMGQRKL